MHTPKHHLISLSLKDGKEVTPSAKTVLVQPGDTLEFTSQDGRVDITFDPKSAVETDPKLGLKRATVRQVPFAFGCFLILADGRRVGYGSGGMGDPGPH